jgi:hypothetical protein
VAIAEVGKRLVYRPYSVGGAIGIHAAHKRRASLQLVNAQTGIAANLMGIY